MEEQPQCPGGPGAPQYPGPPKKRGAGVVLLVLGLLGACVLVTLVVGGYLGWQAYRRAGVQKQAKQTDAHLAEVPARLAAVERAVAGTDRDQPAETKRSLADLGVELDSIAKEVTLASEDAKSISSAPVAEGYGKSVAEAEAGVDAARDAVGYAADLAEIEQRTHQGLQKANAGTDLITAAIGDGNREDYSAQESKASQASTLFSEAEQSFNDAAKLDASADLGKATAWAARSRAEADTIREQAVAASSGDIGKYNELVDKVNALTTEVNAMEHPPALRDAHWADQKLNDMLGVLSSHAENAGTALADANALVDGK